MKGKVDNTAYSKISLVYLKTTFQLFPDFYFYQIRNKHWLLMTSKITSQNKERELVAFNFKITEK